MIIGGSAGAAVLAIYSGTFAAGTLKSCGGFSRQYAESVARIGLAYIENHTSFEELDLILANLSQSEQKKADHLQALADALPINSVEDFEHKRTVTCDGWVISQSEAHFCTQLAITMDLVTPSAIRNAKRRLLT